jgi:SM-20-related protein
VQALFNTLVESFITHKIGIVPHFLHPQLAAQLKQNIEQLMQANQMQTAGTGNDKVVLINQNYRRDKIYWLDNNHHNVHENEFFELIDELVLYLNCTCYTGITGYEFHYTCYPIGSFYKKHIDQFKNNSSRQYSLIMYLNPHWQKADGGELCIYQNDSSQHIAPENGKAVFFKSNEMPHEVLITHQPRWSITGWFKVGV